MTVTIDPTAAPWHDRSAVVAVTGELGLATGPALRDLLNRAVNAHDRTVVDLSGLACCDSANPSTPIAARNTAHRHGTHLLLPSGPLSPWSICGGTPGQKHRQAPEPTAATLVGNLRERRTTEGAAP